MASSAASKRKRKVAIEAPEQPAHWRGERITIKPAIDTVCAICWWSHATILLNDNTYHLPCLEGMMREYHPVPAQLIEEGKA